MSNVTRPRVRRNLRYVRQTLDARVSYVVKDPIRLRYFRFGEVEVWLMQQMDGTRTLREIADGLNQQFDLNVSATSVEPFLAKLKELGLAERTREEQRILLSESLRKQRREKVSGHGNTLLRMRFSLGDPDAVFGRLEASMRFFWTPQFIVLSVLSMVGYGAILAANWGAFAGGVASMYNASFYSPAAVLTLYLTATWIIVIHELGHGLTCKHFGGEVHEWGAMLLYFMPAMYCNVNDAWTFEKRSHRLWVTFAGGWIQLFVAFLAAVAWIGTEPETYIHQVAFISLLIAGGMSVLINFNPLIPLDGYYALMDWLEIPNLRARSFRFIGAWLKHHLLRMNVTYEPHTARERRVFVVYAVLAIAYSTVLLVSIFMLASRFLITRFDTWGAVLVMVALFFLLRRRIGGLHRVMRVWWSDRGSALTGRRGFLYAGGGLGALLLVGLVTPWVVTARGNAWIEAPARVWLRPGDAGLVEQIRATEGQLAKAGDTIAVLRNPELELRWTHARSAVAELEQQAASARARAQIDLARNAETQLSFRRAELHELERRRDGLTLRAPFDGRIVTAHLPELIGAGVARGDSLIELWHAAPARIRIRLPQRDASKIEAGAPVSIRFDAAPGTTVRTHVERIGAATLDGYLELLAPLPELKEIQPGMVGRAKVRLMRTSLAGGFVRAMRRTIRVDWWP